MIWLRPEGIFVCLELRAAGEYEAQLESGERAEGAVFRPQLLKAYCLPDEAKSQPCILIPNPR